MFQSRTSWRTPTRHLAWRTALTIAAAAFVLVYPIYNVLEVAITHGIHANGNLLVVDMKAMSDFSLDQVNGSNDQIPRPYRQLDGKRVMLAGELVVPDTAASPLNRFTLVYSINNCCFAGPPRVQHFVKATVLPGRTVDYHQGVVNVVGTLHVGVEREGGLVSSVYRLDVEKVEP